MSELKINIESYVSQETLLLIRQIDSGEVDSMYWNKETVCDDDRVHINISTSDKRVLNTILDLIEADVRAEDTTFYERPLNKKITFVH